MSWHGDFKKTFTLFLMFILLNFIFVTYIHIDSGVESENGYVLNIVKPPDRNLMNSWIAKTGIIQDTDPIMNKSYHFHQNRIKHYDLVIFTSFILTYKRNIVHNNTKANWPSLSTKVKSILFTNNTKLKGEFLDAGWDVLPLIKVSESGTPILKYMFMEVCKQYNASFIGYANSDILFTESLTITLNVLKSKFSDLNSSIVATGKRIDVVNTTTEEAENFDSLTKTLRLRGNRFRVDAEDYFVTDRYFPWASFPDLVIGRPAIDNFLLLYARMSKLNTVDLTKTVAAIHQVVDKGYLAEKWNSSMTEHLHNRYIVYSKYGKVNYYAGQTNCLTFKTHFQSSKIMVSKRTKLEKYCNLHISNIRKYIKKFLK